MFTELLKRAKCNDEDAIQAILELYKPLLIREAMIDGLFDEDLYQMLVITLVLCIEKYNF